MLALACAAMAMVGLDTAVVNVAVPSIQRDLGVSPSASQWVVVAYGLVLGGFLLFGGRTGRPPRPSAHLRRRARHLHGRVVRGRCRAGCRPADRSPCRAGLRCRARRAGGPVAAGRHLRRGTGAGPGARHLRRRRAEWPAPSGSSPAACSPPAPAGAGRSSSTSRRAVFIVVALVFLTPNAQRTAARGSTSRCDDGDRRAVAVVYALHHAVEHGCSASTLALFAARPSCSRRSCGSRRGPTPRWSRRDAAEPHPGRREPHRVPRVRRPARRSSSSAPC